MAIGSAGSGLLALPMLSDGMNYDWPQYYETIQTGRRLFCHTVQSADLDGDGQDELICRGPAGISAYSFDPTSGQWISLPPGPAWTDEAGWAQEWCYASIQAADLDGDGRAELFGHGPGGTEVWRYHPETGTWQNLNPAADPLTDPSWQDEPACYTTLQCADLDGDGCAELIARSTTGIVAWKLTPAGWQALPDGPGWSDAASWNYPQYYAPIQCADVDGDGCAELIGRDNQQLQVWKLTSSGWENLPYGPPMADADGWNQPQYYATIQFADLDGDGCAELLARNQLQVLAWKLTASGWVELPAGPAMADSNGWDLPQYYSTLQCADIDGDGADELFVRNNTLILVWKLDGSAWQPLAGGPSWSDADGWDLPQYYATIRTARVHSPGSGEGAATQTVDVLIARSAFSMLAYRYAGADWVSTTAQWPVLNQQAYRAVAVLLQLADGQQVRQIYNDDTHVVPRCHSALAKKPGPPPTYTGSLQVWDETVAQLATELGWVVAVHGWYKHIGALTDGIYLFDDMSLSVVSLTLEVDEEKDTSSLSLASFLFNIAWAVLGVEFPVAAAAAGVLATACAAAATDWPVTSVGGTITTLEEDLVNAFASAVDQHAVQQLGITGGLHADGQYVTGDYGMLAAIGSQIDDANPGWSWNDNAQQSLTMAGLHSYSVSCWQTLVIPAQWRWSANPYVLWLDPSYADYVANQWWWDMTGTGEGCSTYYTSQWPGPGGGMLLVPTQTAQLLFGPNSGGNSNPVYPLLVIPGDVLTAQNGWPALAAGWWTYSITGCKNVPSPDGVESPAGAGAVGAPWQPPQGQGLTIVPTRSDSPEPEPDVAAQPRPCAPDLHVGARTLRVDDGQLLVRVTVSNQGLEPAEAVEIVEASLAGRSAADASPTRPTRIGAGCKVSLHVWLPDPDPGTEPADLWVRVVGRGCEHAETVQLQG